MPSCVIRRGPAGDSRAGHSPAGSAKRLDHSIMPGPVHGFTVSKKRKGFAARAWSHEQTTSVAHQNRHSWAPWTVPDIPQVILPPNVIKGGELTFAADHTNGAHA